MRRTLWILSGIVILLLVAGGLYFHLAIGGKTAPPAGASLAKGTDLPVERLPVQTAAVQKMDLAVTLPVFGAINYLDKVDVGAEMPGVLKEVRVEPGDLVQRGQAVAVLDTDLLRAELQTKIAQKAQAEAQLQLAAWQHQAQRKVYRVGGISLNDMEEAEAKYREKQAEVARYAAEIAQTRTQIKKATLISPIVGIVGQKNYNRGERVSSQTEKGVVTLMRIDEVYAEAEVNERDLARLRPGLAVLVFPDAFPQSTLRGIIERLEPVLKPESRSAIAKVRVSNPDSLLKPGMFTRMEVVLDKVPQVLTVPVAALRQAPDKSWYVFVITDEVAFMRKVALGLVTPNGAEIKEGLQPDETVVVQGAERLKDLSRVISSPVSSTRP
jgi:membrane fusion protein (multidrug efflux system)